FADKRRRLDPIFLLRLLDNLANELTRWTKVKHALIASHPTELGDQESDQRLAAPGREFNCHVRLIECLFLVPPQDVRLMRQQTFDRSASQVMEQCLGTLEGHFHGTFWCKGHCPLPPRR